MRDDNDTTHLAASDADTERTACGRRVDAFLVGQSADDTGCKACRRTQRWRDVAAEEGINEEDW